jgi:hypothetical protein
MWVPHSVFWKKVTFGMAFLDMPGPHVLESRLRAPVETANDVGVIK